MLVLVRSSVIGAAWGEPGLRQDRKLSRSVGLGGWLSNLDLLSGDTVGQSRGMTPCRMTSLMSVAS